MCCNEVKAYKSKNGSLYEDKKRCEEADRAYEAQQRRKKEEELTRDLINNFDVISGTHYLRHQDYYGGYDSRDSSYYYAQRGAYDVCQGLAKNWKQLRNMLNAIPDQE